MPQEVDLFHPAEFALPNLRLKLYCEKLTGYGCPSCDKVFRTMEALATHYRVEHLGTLSACKSNKQILVTLTT